MDEAKQKGIYQLSPALSAGGQMPAPHSPLPASLLLPISHRVILKTDHPSPKVSASAPGVDKWIMKNSSDPILLLNLEQCDCLLHTVLSGQWWQLDY